MSREDTFMELAELAAAVALALADGSAPQPDARINAVPDARTIRYYTTLGLLDRPASFAGRKALYGRRHLLQLAAIKRLQARGLSLKEIQTQMLGLSAAKLAHLANVPENPSNPALDPARRKFWTQLPAEPAPTPSSPTTSPALVGITLADEVTLLLHAARPVTDLDLQQLRVAAAPLLALLQKRHLWHPGAGPEKEH